MEDSIFISSSHLLQELFFDPIYGRRCHRSTKHFCLKAFRNLEMAVQFLMSEAGMPLLMA
jgi:hypothetical protein